jgi:steroid delta-isomerase-like uncharacterized protein
MGNPQEVADRSLQAWRSGGAEAFVACYTDDASITAPGGTQLHGHDGVRQFYSMWNEAVPDNEISIERDYVSGSVIVQEGVFSGTHTGNLATPDGQVIPATGRSLRVPYAEVLETEGDQIAASRLYFDQVELMTQLGLMPAPEAAAAS